MDIRNFGAKSIDEVKDKLASMGIALKDSPPGFDPSTYASAYDDNYDDEDEVFEASGEEAASDDDQSFAEDEQL
jgi:DNA-directed RNA polymerase subunit alpha